MAVVAHAVLGMARSLAPDRARAAIAVGGMVLAMLLPSALGQVLVILAAGLIGLVWLRPDQTTAAGEGLAVALRRRFAVVCLVLFALLLAALPLAASATRNGVLVLIDSFYRAGALVFGGGHVVLPLLRAETVQPGLVADQNFLAGYGAAQAVPGPLFTFAAYLGAVTESGPTGLTGAGIALLAVFLPSALLVLGVLPFWERLRRAPRARRALMGVNAGVVGLLAAALYDPVFTEGVTSAVAMAIAAVAFVALTAWKAPAWGVVAAALLGWAVL